MSQEVSLEESLGHRRASPNILCAYVLHMFCIFVAYLCKKHAKNMQNICNKYAKHVPTICNSVYVLHIFAYVLHIFCISMQNICKKYAIKWFSIPQELSQAKILLKVSKWIYNPKFTPFKYNTSWWLNQPIWKIFVKMGSSSPISEVNIKKYLSCHHPNK